jgi:WD40 repeat protein
VPDVATDPGTPNLAYVRAAGRGRAQAVVRDLATGTETTAGASFGSDGPGQARWLSGDLVSYVGAGDNGQTVNWRTGAPSADPRQGWWQAAGVSVNYSEETWTLSTFAGEPLLTVPGDPASSYGSLSPDGRYFLASGTDPGMTVYDVRSGDPTTFKSRSAVGYGWTPDGHLIGTPPSGGEVEICDANSGACEGTGTTTDIAPLLVKGTPGVAL